MELGGRTLLAGMIAGAIAGFLWGGIGGRIAMRIVFLTSNGSVAGLESDDGFTIGVFSSAAVFLVAATTVLGAGLGAMVAVLRTPCAPAPRSPHSCSPSPQPLSSEARSCTPTASTFAFSIRSY